MKDIENIIDVRIDVANEADALGIARVQRAVWLTTYPNEEYNISAEDILQRDFMSVEKIERLKKRLTEDREVYRFWVAKDTAGEVVGYCLANKDVKNYKINALYVLSEYQGRGLGKKLMRCALDWLGNEKEIVLDVVTYNQNAIGFYTSLGFHFTGDSTPAEELAKLPSGKTMPELRMIKSFEQKI